LGLREYRIRPEIGSRSFQPWPLAALLSVSVVVPVDPIVCEEAVPCRLKTTNALLGEVVTAVKEFSVCRKFRIRRADGHDSFVLPLASSS
jgi:hypothetical protein